MRSRISKIGWIEAALAAVFMTACSSESPAPPEPTLRNAGAFFAVDDTKIELYRTLKALQIEGDNILFATFYDVNPTSFDEAREIAKRTDIPIRETLMVFSELQVLSKRLDVVWFRTLTAEEEKRSP
ncbi:MAG: hypothetical protein ABW133_19375 [Polyangiaceae bacterium]